MIRKNINVRAKFFQDSYNNKVRRWKRQPKLLGNLQCNYNPKFFDCSWKTECQHLHPCYIQKLECQQIFQGTFFKNSDILQNQTSGSKPSLTLQFESSVLSCASCHPVGRYLCGSTSIPLLLLLPIYLVLPPLNYELRKGTACGFFLDLAQRRNSINVC